MKAFFTWAICAAVIFYLLEVWVDEAKDVPVAITAAFLVGVVMGLVGTFVSWLKNRKHKRAATQSDQQSIRGWLLVIMIGIALVVVTHIAGLIAIVAWLFNETALQNLPPDFAFVPYFELLRYGVTTILGIAAMILVHKRKKKAVPVAIAYLIAAALLSAADLIVLTELARQSTEPATPALRSTAIRDFLAAVIFIPYFRQSKRVKETLIK